MTVESITARIRARFPDFEVLGFPSGYLNYKTTTVTTRCGQGHVVTSKIEDLLRASRKGCAECLNQVRAKKSPQDFEAEVTARTPHIQLLEPYTTKRTKIRARCSVHGLEWTPYPQSLLKAPGCPECGKASSRAANTKRTEDYRARVKAYTPTIEVQGYTHSNERVGASCELCGHQWTPVAYTLYEHGCPSCATKNHTSKGELELLAAVEGLYHGMVVPNHRDTAQQFEADVWLPHLKLAIDYHGMYNHSEARRDSRYHLRKCEYFEGKGAQLIQVFEQEWIAKRPIIVSMIAAKVGIAATTIYARKTRVVALDRKAKSAFMAANHLQGDDTCRLSFGLVHSDQLVAAMTFAVPAISGSNRQFEWYLSRFVVLAGHSVPGAFSKLLKHFLREHKPSSLATFADRRFSCSASNVYLANGFDLMHATDPNYWYFKQGRPAEKFHRFNFRKSVLSNKLAKFDALLSEHDNMLANGWLRIYDAGNLAYRLPL